MKILRYNKKNEKKLVSLAAKMISKGGIVAFPTDTVYGIAADPFNKNAVRKLYKIKGRTDKKPIALLVSSKNAVRSFVQKVPAAAKRLINMNWPGALTLIFGKKKAVPDFLTSGLPTIGIRMPDSRIALAIIRDCGGALAVTSANISGEKAAVSAGDLKGLKGLSLIIDGGKCRVGVPSSVVVVGGNKLEILRKGTKFRY